jgi:uncharacterized protein with PIN domain
MLNNPSKQVAHCYWRAAECSERALVCADPDLKAFYLEREKSWLRLARSYQLSERIGLWVNEHARNKLLDRSEVLCAADNCPDCQVVMRFYPVEPVVIEWPKAVYTAAYLHCPNCGRLGNY